MSFSSKETVTELTLKGIFSLLDENKKTAVVQILDPEPIPNQRDPKSTKFKVNISDGSAKQKAVLGNEAAQVFNDNGQPNHCIIRINDLMQNQQGAKRLVIITKIEMINTDISECIGQPIEYQDWVNNGRVSKPGVNKIPGKYLSTPRGGGYITQNYNNSASTNAPPTHSASTMNSMNTMNTTNTMNTNANSGGYNNNNNNNNNNSFNSRNFASTTNQGNQDYNSNNSNMNRNTGANNSYNSNAGAGTGNMGSNYGGSTSRNMNMGGGQYQQQNTGNTPKNNYNSVGAMQGGNTYNSYKGGNNNNYENVPPQKQAIKRQGSIGYLGQNQLIPEEEFMTVRQLAPTTSFIIKVRVTSKSDLRSFKRKDTLEENHVFSADLIDKEGDEITATFFGEAAKLFHPQLTENTVYIMKNGTVKLTNSKFNKKNSEFQIIYDRQDASCIIKVDNDAGILNNKFNFVKIKSLQETPSDTIVDVVGYVRECGPCSEITVRKTGELKAKRTFFIYDDSNVCIEMTLWGDMARDYEFEPNQLVIIKAARVSDFGNAKSISGSFSTKIIVDPRQFPVNDQAIAELEEWKNKGVNDDQLQTISAEGGGGSGKYALWTIEEINNATNDVRDAAFFDLVAHVAHIQTDRSTLFYAGCTKCARKAINTEDGRFKCDECKINFPQPVYRYTLSVKLSDHTGSLWISAFDKVAHTIVGEDAHTMKTLKDSDEMAMMEKFRECLYKEYSFKLLAKLDNYMGNTRVKIQATRIDKMSYSKAGKECLNLLQEYSMKQDV